MEVVFARVLQALEGLHLPASPLLPGMPEGRGRRGPDDPLEAENSGEDHVRKKKTEWDWGCIWSFAGEEASILASDMERTTCLSEIKE